MNENPTREKILRDSLAMARHNLCCYSKSLLCNTPKDGHEKDYEKTLAEVKILEAWLKEFHSTRTDSAREFIGHINGVAYGKTCEGKPLAELIRFEVDTGAHYTHGDQRTFHVAPEAQYWFVSEGKCCGKYNSEKDHRDSRLVKITVDRIEYVRSIEWVISE